LFTVRFAASQQRAPFFLTPGSHHFFDSSMSSWSTTDTKTAAAYAGLGFAIETRETIICEKDRTHSIRFHIADQTLGRSPALYSRHLHQLFIDGALAKTDPLHPLLCGLAACANMDALHLMMRGLPHRLVLINGLYLYQPGDELPSLFHAPRPHRTLDLPLAGAVSVVGIPATHFEYAESKPGKKPQRFIYFPDAMHVSYPVTGLTVAQHFQRRGTEPHPHALQLGLTHPEHPVVHAYNATRAYAQLLAEVKTRRILAKDPYSSRRALIPENPSPALENEVRRFFRIP
jgi:hypothetical protein